MFSVSSKTCKEDTNENSTNLMLDLSTKMTHNKDSNTDTTEREEKAAQAPNQLKQIKHLHQEVALSKGEGFKNWN